MNDITTVPYDLTMRLREYLIERIENLNSHICGIRIEE